MQFIQGQQRQQTYFSTLEDQVSAHWRNVFPYKITIFYRNDYGITWAF